jgi:hypothetical protein
VTDHPILTLLSRPNSIHGVAFEQVALLSDYAAFK